MKLRLPQRRVTRAAIYLGSFVLVLLAVDLVLVQVRRTIHPSYETTRIIEPKMADGRIDYCAAVAHRDKAITYSGLDYRVKL